MLISRFFICFEEALELVQFKKMTIELIVAKVIHSVLVAAALVGNVLVCLAILRNKIYRPQWATFLWILPLPTWWLWISSRQGISSKDYTIIPVAW